MANKIPFGAADILLPKKDFDKWAVVACDQFTSQPEYWEEAKKITEGSASALDLILPEVYLSSDNSEYINKINANMKKYLDDGVFDEYGSSMIYVERTIPGGKVRHGIVGAVDLEAYDYEKGSTSPIRATEGTVLSRIPPRVAIRREAPLELPHVMILIDDPEKTVVEPLADSCEKVAYDTDLMLGGGHIKGSFISAEMQEKVMAALSALRDGSDSGVFFAVGDGNHSLATAKECYRNDPNEKNRYALAEIVNIHDDALAFEPIYRLLLNVDTDDLLAAVAGKLNNGAKTGTVVVNGSEAQFKYDGLSTAAVQSFIDEYIAEHPEVEMDYIHGEETVRKLGSKENRAGFIFDGMDKSELFGYVEQFGALPRKTFSMGDAESKRYYMEARRIK